MSDKEKHYDKYGDPIEGTWYMDPFAAYAAFNRRSYVVELARENGEGLIHWGTDDLGQAEKFAMMLSYGLPLNGDARMVVKVIDVTEGENVIYENFTGRWSEIREEE